jgi:hypothetical protein
MMGLGDTTSLDESVRRKLLRSPEIKGRAVVAYRWFRVGLGVLARVRPLTSGVTERESIRGQEGNPSARHKPGES